MTSQNALNNKTVDAPFTVNRTTAGQPSQVSSIHSDATSALSEAIFAAQSQPGANADSFFQASIAGITAVSWGIDQSDGNALKETNNNTSASPSVGTLTRKVFTTGEQIMPLQPAFRATVSAIIPNVTGNGTVYEVIFDNQVTDQNADYNPVTGRFTAPVDGFYSFQSTVAFAGLVAANTSGTLVIAVNGGATNVGIMLGSPFATSSALGDNYWNIAGSIFLTAGQFVSVFLQVNGGLLVTDINAPGISLFSGALLC